jgi:hypothetical protein
LGYTKRKEGWFFLKHAKGFVEHKFKEKKALSAGMPPSCVKFTRV